MEHKVILGRYLKSLEETGDFSCVFATLQVVDGDGDVTLPGAFGRQNVRISAWGHKWGDLPVGKGVIYELGNEAICDGRFFLDTAGGRETYRTVKNLGDLQQWSYGFDVLKSRPGSFEGRQVRFLEKVKVYEVSPVFLGAGVNTRTTAIKSPLRLTLARARQAIRDLFAPCAGEIARWRKKLADIGLYLALDDLKPGNAPARTNLDALYARVAAAHPDAGQELLRILVDGEIDKMVRQYARTHRRGGAQENTILAEARLAILAWLGQPAL